MKKFIILSVITAMLFTACNNVESNDPNTEEQENLTIDDYYPFTENAKYSYEGEGNEFASYTIYTDYIDDNKIQIRINNDGTEIVEVLEKNKGELKKLISRPETYFRQNFLEAEVDEVEILLKEPIQVGNNWTVKESDTRTITDLDVEIETPYGTYNAIEVTTEGTDYKTIDYYVKDIGLIKTVNRDEYYEVTSELTNIEENVPLTQDITLFYPNIDGETLNTTTVQISFETNEDAINVIEKSIKDLTEYKILTDNVKVNELYYNEENNNVSVDFSTELITEMNAGAGFEALILQSITNTLGVYYGVEEVYLTVDRNPYESGHILIEKDEPLIVNLDNVKSID